MDYKNYKSYNDMRRQAEGMIERALASGNEERAKKVLKIANRYVMNYKRFLSGMNAYVKTKHKTTSRFHNWNFSNMVYMRTKLTRRQRMAGTIG